MDYMICNFRKDVKKGFNFYESQRDSFLLAL